MTNSKSKVYKLLSSMNGIKWSVAIKGLISGVVAGFLVVLYRLAIEYGTETAVKIYSYLKFQFSIKKHIRSPRQLVSLS